MSEKKQSILLVQLSAHASGVVQQVIQKVSDYQITSIPNAYEAVAFLEKQSTPPKLIILEDTQILSSNRFLQERLENPKWQEIPIIIFTDDVSFRKLRTLREHKLPHVLIIPTDENLFYDKFKRALKLKHRFSQQTLKRIRSVEFFKNFNLDTLMSVLDLGHILHYQPGDVIIKETGVVSLLGIVIHGELGIYRITNEEEAIHINTLTKNSFLGESTLLSRSRSNMRVVSETKSIVFGLPYFAFQLFSVELRDQLYRLIILELTKKLQQMSQKSVQLQEELEALKFDS